MIADRPRNTEAKSAAMKLSQDSLQALQAAYDESDTHYAENVTSAERQTVAYQELGRSREQTRKRDATLAFDAGEADAGEADRDDETDVEDTKALKRPRTSVETPFRRYMTIGPDEDPFPLYGKQAMESVPVKYGSLKDAPARRDAAVLLEQNIERPRAERCTL